MANDKIILTQKGKEKLEQELIQLTTVERPEIKDRIKEAREYGDLSENADYHAARARQGEIEDRIIAIENILKKAKIVESTNKDIETVGVGTKVTVYDEDLEEEEVYNIVGSVEADPANGFISYVSPLGSALCGKKVGDEVTIHAKVDYTVKITKIESTEI